MRASPQPGIFAEGARYHYHLEYRITGAAESVRDALRSIPELARGGDCGQWLVAGLGQALWSSLAPGVGPSEVVAGFETLEGPDGRRAPSTQRDLWLWLQGSRHDDNLERAMALDAALGPVATLELDLPAFTYLESRDLTGFEDGTANPKGEDARVAALIPEGEPGAGGSIALTQQWVTDLEAFGALPVAEQERVIGRTKADSIELEGDAMPADSHVSRTDVSVDGQAMKVWRRSTPYGTVRGEHGLYFVSFACERRRHQIQLERMFGTTGDGLHDRLIHFSTAVTGSYWLVPSMTDLAAALGD